MFNSLSGDCFAKLATFGFMNRRKFNRLLAFMLVVGLVLTTAYVISAQQSERRQRPEGQQQQRPQMDPAEMMKQRVEQIMKALNPSEEEAAVLKPKIEGLLQTRIDQSRETRNLIDALRKAIEAKDDAQIEAKLSEVKAKRKEHKANIEKLENELIELLTVKQEAQLTVSGVINSDGFGSFFGNRRGPAGGGGGQPGASSGTRSNQ
jgi:Spy/CpxP family protein refolding chaperone